MLFGDPSLGVAHGMLFALTKRIPLKVPQFASDIILVISDNIGLDIIFLDFEPAAFQ